MPAGDLVTATLMGLFQRLRATEQVRRELQTRHVTLSPSAIEYLGCKFITYLATLSAGCGQKFTQSGLWPTTKSLRAHAATKNLNALIRQARQYIEKQSADTEWMAIAIKEGKNLGDIQQISFISAYSLALWCLKSVYFSYQADFLLDKEFL